MAKLVAGLLFLCCSASCYRFSGYEFGDPVLEWNALSAAKEWAPGLKPRANSQTNGSPPTSASTPTNAIPSTPSNAVPVPPFLRVSASDDPKALLKPEFGTRQLQDAVKDILLVTPLPPTTVPTSPPLVEMLCLLDRLFVRVRRELFSTVTAYKYLKLGPCPVNGASDIHYYFRYLLTSPCGFTKQPNPDRLVVSASLTFSPQGAVLWEVPFKVPLQCSYHRVHHSYSPGIYPILEADTVYKKLESKLGATIIPQDAVGNELTGLQTYTLGSTMYFVAKLTDAPSAGQRLYASRCYMTASQDSTSNPKYTVIENQGCMVAGKVTEQAKFLTQASKMSLRFSLSASVFKDMIVTPGTPKKIYLHCALSAGPLTATESMKSCNYDTATKKWIELYDGGTVCSCCDASCGIQPKASKLVYTSSPLVVGGLALESTFKSGNVDNEAGFFSY